MQEKCISASRIRKGEEYPFKNCLQFPHKPGCPAMRLEQGLTSCQGQNKLATQINEAQVSATVTSRRCTGAHRGRRATQTLKKREDCYGAGLFVLQPAPERQGARRFQPLWPRLHPMAMGYETGLSPPERV